MQSGAVLFNLPDQQDPHIWFKGDENAKANFIRARAFLLEHDPVTLTIAAATKSEACDSAPGGDEKRQEPHFTDAEDWLKKQMLPSVETVLAQKYPDAKLSRLVGYQSLPIQAKEGSDVSMIQVERGAGAARQIAGHLRVYRSKWVGQSADVQATHASATAEATVRVLAEARKEARVRRRNRPRPEKYFSQGSLFGMSQECPLRGRCLSSDAGPIDVAFDARTVDPAGRCIRAWARARRR